MDTTFIIAISVIAALTIGFIIHRWLHKLLTFKMDEGSIIQFFKENKPDQPIKLQTIAVAVKLTEVRALEVCSNSHQLIVNGQGLWSSKA
jgi:hypothetical protein